jgi:exopolyphosphatase/guanosine-5'-triphosphate,3'-diphosphate pyrophosphatase
VEKVALEKIAVIDLGSNNVNMVFAHVLPSEHFVVFDQIKETVRLGAEMSRDGFLKPSRVSEVVKVLKMFRKLCENQQIDKVYVIATSAVRRAKNQKSFLEEIGVTCGFKVRVLSESEEAELIGKAVSNNFDTPKGLIVDISGSSIQLIKYNRKGIIDSQAIRYGNITIIEKFEEYKNDPVQLSANIEAFVKQELMTIDWLKSIDQDVNIIGVGGFFRSLAKMSMRLERYPLDVVHNYNVRLEAFDNVYTMLKSIDVNSSTKIKGITGRADTFCSSMYIAKAILSYLSKDGVVVSEYGLREGVLLSHSQSANKEKIILDPLGSSIYARLNYLHQDIPQLEHIYNLCMQLYKQLKVLHKLPRQYNKALRMATFLHECGKWINNTDFVRHSMYYVLNSGIVGVSHRELIVTGFAIMSYLHDEFNNVEWVKYRGIVSEEDKVAAIKIGIILRLAYCLDRTNCRAITELNCDILGDSIIIKTLQSSDASLEIAEATKLCQAQFAKAFKKNIKIL